MIIHINLSLFVLTANETIQVTIAPSTVSTENATQPLTDAPTTIDESTTTLKPVQTTKDELNVTEVASTQSPSTILPESSTGFNFFIHFFSLLFHGELVNKN